MIKRIQKEIWDQEHLSPETLLSLSEVRPSSNIVLFVEYLQKNNLLKNRKILDIGCGKGRNAIYLAQNGLEVYAFDFIKHAINYAKTQAKLQGVENKINFSEQCMDETWSFSNDYFDLAVDCFSSIDIETKQGREVYKYELLRTLKPGGIALICVVAASDEFEAYLIKNYPGEERNSSVWPQNGKFQKNYDKEELLFFYDLFSVLDFKIQTKKATKMNKTYIATNYWLLLQKPVKKL